MSTIEELLEQDQLPPPDDWIGTLSRPHDNWVAMGFCSYIASSQAWCNRLRGHGPGHEAPMLQPDGNVRTVPI